MATTLSSLSRAWTARQFIMATVKRDFRSRYMGTQLGVFWLVAQPLAMIAIYTLIFAEIMKPSLPGHETRFAYGINLCAGIVVWQLFSDLLGRSVGMFVANANLLKKSTIPKAALPAIAAVASLSNFAIILFLFIAFLLLTSSFPGVAVLGIVPVIAIVVAFTCGLGLLLGSVNVFYRDVEQTLGLVLNFWFWLTPIVYPVRSLPEYLSSVLQWNPMWPLVSFAQEIFVDARVPALSTLAYPALASVLLLVVGATTYRRLAAEMVDEL